MTMTILDFDSVPANTVGAFFYKLVACCEKLSHEHPVHLLLNVVHRELIWWLRVGGCLEWGCECNCFDSLKLAKHACRFSDVSSLSIDLRPDASKCCSCYGACRSWAATEHGLAFAQCVLDCDTCTLDLPLAPLAPLVTHIHLLVKAGVCAIANFEAVWASNWLTANGSTHQPPSPWLLPWLHSLSLSLLPSSLLPPWLFSAALSLLQALRSGRTTQICVRTSLLLHTE